jgi:hypothetical protein
MVKQIIKEAMEKNPIGLKEAVEAELMHRLQLALEAKKSRFDLEESFKDYSHSSMEESVNSSDVPFDREYKSLIKRFETEIKWDSVLTSKDGASTAIIAKKNDTKYYISFVHPRKQRNLLINGWTFVDVSVGSLYLGEKYFTKTGEKIENRLSKSGRRPIDWLNAYKEMVSDGTIKENIREAETALQKLKSHVNNKTKLEEGLEESFDLNENKNKNSDYIGVDHPDATPEQIHKALTSRNKDARRLASTHPNMSPENIHKALSDSDSYIRFHAAHHPNMSPKNIDKALKDENPDVRKNAARHPNATPKNIDNVLSHKDPSTRGWGAGHPNASPENIHRALKDESEFVRSVAAAHRKASHDHISKALEDKSPMVRKAAAFNRNASREHINKALNDKDPNVRRNAAANPARRS